MTIEEFEIYKKEAIKCGLTVCLEYQELMGRDLDSALEELRNIQSGVLSALDKIEEIVNGDNKREI